MKIFYSQYHSPSQVYHCLIFKNNLSIGIAQPQNCCREKEWHKKRREREREGVFKSFFLTLSSTKR
jgi:hypothetical protein